MNKPQSGKVIGVVFVIAAFALSTFAQSQPTKLLNKGKSILSGRAIDPPPARAPKPIKGGEVWSTRLPPVNSGGSIPGGATKGSVTVGGGGLKLRRPAKPAELLQRPVAQANATSASRQASQAKEAGYASILKRQDPAKLSPEGRKIRGAAIRNAEERSGAAKARADRVVGDEARTRAQKSQTKNIVARGELSPRIPKAQRVKPPTAQQRHKVYEKNRAKNAGQLRCDECTGEMSPGQKSRKGVSPRPNEATVDHVVPRSRGGSNKPKNLRAVCRKCNREKSDND